MTGPTIDFDYVTMKTLTAHYPNLHINQINLNDFVAGTPLDYWYHCSGWDNGKHHVAHLADGLRLLTLYKYGGYYLDLDIIHLRPITPLKNFICAQDEKTVANGAIHAEYGQPVIKLALHAFVSNYRYQLFLRSVYI